MKKSHGPGTQREIMPKTKWPISDDFGLRSVLSHSENIFAKKRYTSIATRVEAQLRWSSFICAGMSSCTAASMAGYLGLAFPPTLWSRLPRIGYIRPCNLLARAEKMASFGSGNPASYIRKRKPWVASRDSREYPCPVSLPFDTCAPQLRRVLQRHDRRLRTGKRPGYRPHSRNARVMRQSLLQLRVHLLRARVRLPVSLWKRSAGSRDRSGGEHVRPGEDECYYR